MIKNKPEKNHLYNGKDHRKKMAEFFKSDIKTHEQMISTFAVKSRVTFQEGRPRGKSVRAFVNAGRWVAQCECGGAEIVDPDNLVFFCCSCGNKENGAKLRKVIMPKNMEDIENELLKRKEPNHRNWRGESVDKIKKERLDYGI